MWLALGCALLLLLAFGSKAVSLLIRIVLLGVHKVGLLSNIRLDAATTLRVTIEAIRIRVWRNVWRFVRAPTQHPLVSVEVGAVHVVVILEPDKIRNRGVASTEGAEAAGTRWDELDTSASFKHLDHPQWKHVRKWMHRLPFAWFLLPLVRVSLVDVAVDIVQDDAVGRSSVMQLQNGHLTTQLLYHIHEGVIELSLGVCRHEAAILKVPESGINVTLRDLQVKISIPVSCAAEDIRVPLPSSLSFSCEGLQCSIDMSILARTIAQNIQFDDEKDSSRHISDESPKGPNGTTFAQGVITSHGLLLLRIIELIPDIHARVCNIALSVVNGADQVGGHIETIECRLNDPLHSSRFNRWSRENDNIGQVAHERNASIDVIHLRLSSDLPLPLCDKPSGAPSENSCSVCVDTIKVEVYTRLTGVLPSMHHADQKIVPTGTLLSWSLRCTGEARGLAVHISEKATPWVNLICPSTASPVQGPSRVAKSNFPEDFEDAIVWSDIVATEMQVQFKILRIEVICRARKYHCEVLPNGVPDIGLSVEEVILFFHPFAGDELIGVRAKIDLQASRLKLFYQQTGRLLPSSFLSIDFVRVFVEPVCMLGLDRVPAEVEMEAEWLEVRWTPEAMHAIGGMLELGIVILATFYRERYDWTSDEHWDPLSAKRIPSMRTISQIVEDDISPSETITFRCKVKRSLVLFSHYHGGCSHIDYVTVDTLNMSVEETTGRFRLSVLDVKVSHVEGAADLRGSPSEPLIQQQHKIMRRRPSTLPAYATHSKRRRNGQHMREPGAPIEGLPFFCVQVFALEENAINLCPMKVLDLFVDGVTCLWDMQTQERIIELVRRITFSSWEMLYRMRKAYGVHCTSPTSRYNRQGGRNGVTSNISQCEDAERLLLKLISSGGDALNRIHATNIDLTAVFKDETCAFDVHLRVGLFGSDDLPELWLFEKVAITVGHSLKLLTVDRVVVRHTVDKRRDYVFGFFEESLRIRKLACGKLPPNQPRDDGMIIDIEGLCVGLSLQVDLVALANAAQTQVSPFVESQMRSFLSPWRPQHDHFYNVFLRIPNTLGQPKIWLQMNNIQVDCVDNPMEAWLEHVYPLWMEELAEQELRSQLLDEQVNALKLTNAEMLTSDEIANEMKSLLHEKSSKIYVHKLRRLQDSLRPGSGCDPLRQGSILTVRIGSVAVDVSSEPNEIAVTELIRGLDEATPSVDQALDSIGLDPRELGPQFVFCVHQHVDVTVTDMTIRMRDFPTPVAVIEQVKVDGHVIAAAFKSPDGAVPVFPVTSAARCYVDLHISIQRPVVFFGPAYTYAMLKVSAIAERVLPSLLLDVDRAHRSSPWDIARRLLHGKLGLKVQDTAIRMFASSNTFEVGDYLEIGVQVLDVDCVRGQNGAVNVTMERLTVKIEPDALVNIAEITSVTLHVEATWSARKNAMMHYVLPIAYCRKDGKSNNSVVVVNLQDETIWNGRTVDLAANLKDYRGIGFSLSISGKIAPKNATEFMTRRDIASRSAIVLYTKHVEWLIQFGRSYVYLAHVKFPSRGHRKNESKKPRPMQVRETPLIDRFLGIFSGVVIKDFGVLGLDVALYHSEKSQVGVRACINDKITFSGSLNSFQTLLDGRSPTKPQHGAPRHISINCKGFAYVIDSVSLAVSDVQVRVCTLSTGSRGETLVSIHEVCLNVGGGGSCSPHPFDFSVLHSELLSIDTPADATSEERERRLSTFRSLSSSSSISSQSADVANEISRTKSKMTILDHFAIPQHNPYQFRNDNDDAAGDTTQSRTNSDTADRTNSKNQIQATFVEDFRRNGFLLGFSASEIRVLVTLDAVETLVDIVENWVRVVRGSLPELSRVPDELMKPPSAQDPNPHHVVSMDSPKKATSLADDPKFGPIFHSSNPLPNNRTPSFTLDAPAEISPSQLSPGSNTSIVEPFLIVRFMDCQINFQDHQNKGSVLLALSRGTVRHSRSHDERHELVDTKVDGVQLFTAPLDVDVRSRVIWLRTLEDGFTYCPSSFGLLKQVVAPIPATVMIWIDQNITVTNRVDLCIPTVQIGVNIDSKNILENLAVALTSVITAKLAEYQAPDYSKMLQGFRGTQSQVSIQSSLQQLVAAKKHLKWKIAELHWRHACRWNYQISERTGLAMHAAERIRNHSSLELDTLYSPHLPPRRMSSVSLASSMGTSVSLTGSSATHVESAPEELQRLEQQHESVGEVLRSLVAAEILKRQPNPNVQLTFTLQNASLTLSATNSDIVSAAMTNLNVKLKMYEDQSGTFALTIQDVCCKNLCPNTPYPELLVPLNNSKSWSGDEMFVRIDAEVAPPVGGIKVVRHFEINVHPMQVCLSYDLILQLVTFFTSVSGPTPHQEEKKAEVRSQFLAAPQQSGSSTGEGLLRKAVKVAGKAAHPLTHGLGRHRSDTESDQPIDPRVKAMQALQEEATLWIARVARAEASKPNASEEDPLSPNAAEKEVSEMRDRANNNILFKRIRLGTVEVMVSFKNKKSNSVAPQQALEDMRGFEVKIHSLVYSDKTCSLMDLLLRIRRDVILDVLSQVGRNFTNVANFLRDQLDITRWGAFDALAPLKSLSTAIGATSQSSVASTPPSPASAPLSSPGGLSVEMLQRSPRISRDTSSVAMPPVVVDTSKVFQLELPENHPSRRKKHTSQPRPSEPVGKLGDAISVPISPLGSSKAEKDDGDALSSVPGSSAGKTRKALSSLFGKSRRTLATPDETTG